MTQSSLSGSVNCIPVSMIPSRPSWNIQHILYLGEDIVGLLSIEEAIQVSTAISVDQLNKQSTTKNKRKKQINK